jgi:hypothetical protein
VNARGLVVRWGARSGLAVVVAGLLCLFAAPGAQAAGVPAGSVRPYLNCYWDNGDGTVTVSIGVTSTNAATVSVFVGTDNRVTQGAPDRGQPETFDPGTHNNVWAFTVTYAEINSGINWALTGNSVAVDAVNQCATKPQLAANGNGMAILAFGAGVTVIGGVFLNGQTGSRRRIVGTG